MGQTTGKVPCPKCPFCGNETVAISIENHDGSGWTCGWTCDCHEVAKWEAYRESQESFLIQIHYIPDGSKEPNFIAQTAIPCNIRFQSKAIEKFINDTLKEHKLPKGTQMVLVGYDSPLFVVQANAEST